MEEAIYNLTAGVDFINNGCSTLGLTKIHHDAATCELRFVLCSGRVGTKIYRIAENCGGRHGFSIRNRSWVKEWSGLAPTSTLGLGNGDGDGSNGANLHWSLEHSVLWSSDLTRCCTTVYLPADA